MKIIHTTQAYNQVLKDAAEVVDSFAFQIYAAGVELYQLHTPAQPAGNMPPDETMYVSTEKLLATNDPHIQQYVGLCTDADNTLAQLKAYWQTTPEHKTDKNPFGKSK